MDDAFYSSENTEIQNTKDYLVVYRNGQVAYESRSFAFYPEGVTGLDAAEPENFVLGKGAFEKGKAFCKISYASSPVFIGRPEYYQTTIENIGKQKIRVLGFGAFEKTGGNVYKLNTITGSLFTADDFNSWYMDSADCWIYPGQIVADPINYGGNKNNWAYKIETEDGDLVWVGEMA